MAKIECEIPSVNADRDEIRAIFDRVRTIAVIGLSPNETKDSHRVARYLQSVGYTIIPVYPKGDTILGETVYRSLAEIPGRVDMVDIFRKPAAFDAVADACIARGDVRVFWGQIGLVNNTAAEKARDAGMTVVQNLCAMVEHRALTEE